MRSTKRQMTRALLAGAVLLVSMARVDFGAEGVVWRPQSGFNEAPFQILNEVQGAKVFFTTDGSLPSPGSGKLFSEPLTITNTTVLRLAAFQDGRMVGDVATRSYIFPRDVVRQTGMGFPATWGTNNGAPVPAYYEMSPKIALAAEYREQIERGFRAIPTVSLVLAPDDLFGEARGIYAHPQETGGEWERAASFEFLTGDRKGIQVNCGVRIQGGWNRRPEESPKHAFRLVFKKKYGAGKLKYALFGEKGEFDSLILRAGCNNSWLHWSGVERRRAEFIRDQWMRETYREMGQLSAEGMFVHLYLNGLYWGVYNIAERPDASFAASHLGGDPEDYDSFNADKTVEGDRVAWTELMRRVNKGVKTSTDFSAVSELLEMESFIDYMIVNFYGANADWDRASNWYAARRRNPPGKFRFFVWDAERTLEQMNDDRISFDDDESPPRIFHRLAENEEFRKLFSKRVQKHLLNEGALTPKAAAERYHSWSMQLELPIIAESARWGDYRRGVHQYKEGPYETYTRDEHWKPEVQRLLTEYFPQRTGMVLEQFRGRGLWDGGR